MPAIHAAFPAKKQLSETNHSPQGCPWHAVFVIAYERKYSATLNTLKTAFLKDHRNSNEKDSEPRLTMNLN